MNKGHLKGMQQRIVERIRIGGPLTFANYMRIALYEPDYGYYVSGAAKMGWEGDYFTSSDVTPLFAHCLGRQLLQMWAQLGQPAQFGVLEQGAGRGDLSRQVRLWATREEPTFASALDYRTGDIATGEDALNGSSAIDIDHTFVPRVIFSNELVDAFPVHIVEKHDNQLYEVYVAESDGRLYEILADPSSEAVSKYLDEYGIAWRTFQNGWRAEINLDARAWMVQTAQMLFGSSPRGKRHGFVVAIDYGDTARRLYIPERERGTLTCYYDHQLSEQPLIRPGEQDITAHVNFTALVQEGRQQGLRLHKLTTQREWLMDMGIYEELELTRQQDFAVLDHARASDEGQIALLRWYNLRQRVMALTSRGGMGDFKVLIMKR